MLPRLTNMYIKQYHHSVFKPLFHWFRNFFDVCIYCVYWTFPIGFLPVASSGIKMTTGAGGMNRKSGTPNPLTMAGKLEHALVAQTIKEIIGPRFTDQVRREAEGRRGGEAKKYLFKWIFWADVGRWGFQILFRRKQKNNFLDNFKSAGSSTMIFKIDCIILVYLQCS